MTKPATMGFSLDFLILEVLQPAFMGIVRYPKQKDEALSMRRGLL